MNEIQIKEIKFRANHGVFDFEKEQGQEFILSLRIRTNFEETLFEDNLKNTIHYGIISEEAVEFLQENTFDLIETAAYRCSDMLFKKYNDINFLELSIAKPKAPVELDFKNILVNVKLKRNIVYISIGSSKGNKDKYFTNAINMLKETSGIYNILESKRYKSAPYGGVAKSEFLNSVIQIETILSPNTLLKVLNNIEDKLEREREKRWADRTIDLDILFYNKNIIDEKHLIIPHPEIEKRDFVLIPLLDLNKNLINPLTKKSIKESLEDLKNNYIKE